MCGIFGFFLDKESLNNYEDIEHDLRLLFLLSQVRGQDSAGMAVLSHDEIKILRRPIKPSLLIKVPEFRQTLKSAYLKQAKPAEEKSSFIIIGQSRLVTHGSGAVHDNNQPVYTDNFAGVHNGIVLNTNRLGITAEGLTAESDSKLLLRAIDALYKQSGDLIAAISSVFSRIEGTASVALLSGIEKKLIIASNIGSLYYLIKPERQLAIFASESKMLNNFLKKSRLFNFLVQSNIQQVKAGSGIEFGYGTIRDFHFDKPAAIQEKKTFIKKDAFPINDVKSSILNLKRCARCILPSTYPFISFDEKGVCNFCRRFEKQKFHGTKELEKLLRRYRSKDGSPDCLVGISGGRDSSYGLHILKTQYDMHPIAYTYDWGLTTDVSRRNQARVCGKLGIEHIIRAPDIKKKRRHIRKNIYAWLKNPQLGMVPLFMAGDKDFYHFGRKLRREINVDLTVFCSGYLLEQREFFAGFCGVDENITRTARTYHYSNIAKLKLAFWYILQYIKNPRYINESFFDSLRSYFTTFLSRDDFLYLYEYLPWEEKKMEEVIKKEYGWESYKDYGSNQWRMGDGQTAFTNYIFYTVAGFSEFDNFRSNQIREGLLTRDEALKLAEKDNQPKYEVLQYFSYLIGFNLDEVLAQINSIPKLY